MGAVMLKARRLGWCERTNRTRPSVRSNLSGKPVWRSVIFHDATGFPPPPALIDYVTTALQGQEPSAETLD